MANKVTQGRCQSFSDDLMDNRDETMGTPSQLNQQHRQVSQSLPKFTTRPSTSSTGNNKEMDKSAVSTGVDRHHKKKYKGPSMKSFSNFLQKIARSVSSTSLNKTRDQKHGRSQSMNLAEARGGDRASTGARRGSVQSASDVLDRTADSRPPSSAMALGVDKVPGVSGIKNHGNTCFMNAVLQCLSHTDLLAEYFVTDHYKNDIRRNNKLNSKKFGTKGELTEALAVLLKSLWSCQYTADVSSEFKQVVGKHGSQYRGYSQHDAQEFLMWILDKIHEDLNIATKKKYRANKVMIMSVTQVHKNITTIKNVIDNDWL